MLGVSGWVEPVAAGAVCERQGEVMNELPAGSTSACERCGAFFTDNDAEERHWRSTGHTSYMTVTLEPYVKQSRD